MNYFGAYLILHFFHCFSADNLPLNLDIPVPLMSFHRIFSALSKYVQKVKKKKKKKKKTTPIYFNTNYRAEMKLLPIIMD